jgi:hypothetical protein
MVTRLACVGFLWKHNAGTESSRIIDGSNIMYFYAPGESGLDVGKIGRFAQERHQLPPAVEREVTGMKTGETKTGDPS